MEYENVSRSALKLKGVSDHKIKKKKKKKNKEKDVEKMYEESTVTSHSTLGDDSAERKTKKDKRTKAEIAYDKAREKRDAEDILMKATKSHKERIMEFNKQLDAISEHFDIPKVSWTK